MCSLFGILGPGFASTQISLYQNASLKMKHRGPDNSDYVSGNNFFLSHNRLNVTGGLENNQPTYSRSKRSNLIFNGQIYNCQDLVLKYDLLVNSANDSQVLVELLEKFGTSILKDVNGVFAGIFVDPLGKNATLFRDKIGARPLFFYQKKDAVLAASEISSIIEFIGPQQVDIKSVAEVFALNFTVSKDTFFQDIRMVPAATCLSVSLETGQIISQEKYFTYTRTPAPSPTTLELKAILVESLKRQIPTSWDTVIYLSSGLDSSLIAILCSEITSNISTATVRYSNLKTCESQYAKKLASTLNINWRAVDINEQKFRANLASALIALQEPRIGQSCINYILHKELASDFRIAFSGAGADELFGGYPWRYPLRIVNQRIVPIPQTLEDTAEWITSKWCRVGHLQTAIDCLNTNIQFNSRVWTCIVESQLKNYQIDWNDSWASVEACLTFERDNFLKNLLTVDDSHSMQFGLEVRVPFLDDEMIRASQTFHPSELFSYCSKTDSILGKAPLRQLMLEIGFPEIASRQKLGFSAPTNLVADSILEFLFNGENKGFYSLDRPSLENLISTLGDREKQSLLWILAEINALF